MDEQVTQRPEAESPKAGGRSDWWSGIFTDWVLSATWGAVFGLDQLTKYLVRANLRLGESWPAEGFARITHGTNTGTIFGLFSGQTVLLTVLSFGAIAFLFYFYRTHALPSPFLRFAIGLLLGGAFGNLLDRLRMGTVTDFVDIGPWPIFNVADSSIVVGIALMVTLSVFTTKTEQPGQKANAPPGDGA
ncbi:MAG: signal peptidase II [SAR202 cluster bacterium]|nr:signal peptidase II [SAR202 cluster bacterium]